MSPPTLTPDDLAPKPARESEAMTTHMILPGDANPLNAAFGGKVMEWIDICGGIAAQRHSHRAVVTASMDDLHFHAPIRVGWIVTVRARVLAVFHTSMEVGVTVTAEDPLRGMKRLTTSALLTFVALDAEGNKVRVPPLLLENDDEKLAFQEAHARRDERIARRGQGLKWQRVLGVEPEKP